MIDFTEYSKKQLEKLRIEVITEQERRENFSAFPAQLTALADEYVRAGGTQSEVDVAVARAARRARRSAAGIVAEAVEVPVEVATEPTPNI